MAHMYPILSETQLANLPSMAEAVVYRCLRDSLDDTYLVIHSRSYIAVKKGGGRRDGETDFVIFSARHGLLVVEVKGGGVHYDPAIGWRSINGKRVANEIKNPFIQAKNQKYSILDQLQASQRWMKLNRRITIGHAVLLPDLNKAVSFTLPEAPVEIVGVSSALNDIKKWLDSVFKFWAGPDLKPLGDDGLIVVEQVLCHPIEVRPLLRDILKAEDALRIRLTTEQASVLRILGRHKRAGIVGAAGTGKTILAVEKARMLADVGANVLLLCYNKALGVMLRRQFSSHGNVHVFTFHQFCQECCRRCVQEGIPDAMERAKAEVPKHDEFEIQYPLAAFYALEALGEIYQFDAIIVDEGQDFGEEYWLPVEMALRSSKASWLYVFYDENQRLYSRVSSFPIPETETFPLTKNCRNAKQVHDLAYRYYAGEPADDSGIIGIDPTIIEERALASQAKQIARHITRLIHDEGVNPESIAVLISGQPKEVYYDLLGKEPLPRPLLWSREEHFQTGSVLMDTVRRFKGLERDVIFLWVEANSVLDDALMYVGISRAKSILYLVADTDAVKQFQLDKVV